MLLVSVQIVVVIDYTFTIDGNISEVMVILTFYLATFAFLAVCYYFIEGASQLLDDSNSIMKSMRIYTACAVIATMINVIYICFMIFKFDISDDDLCKKWYFIPSSVVDALTNLFFFT